MGQVLVWHLDANRVFGKREGREVKDREFVIEEWYQRIEDEALKNNIRIRKVVLGNSVKEIGVRSFYNCTNLQTLEMACVEKIHKAAFSGCTKLKEIWLPNELYRLGKGAFSGCRRLVYVAFPCNQKYKIIEENSFAECESLQSCAPGEYIRDIRARAFYKCISLEEFVFPPQLHSIGKEAFYQTILKELLLPDRLEVIGDSAFFKCNRLEYVRIPLSVKSIEKWAFHGCNRLKVLEIAHDPEHIGEWIINRSARIRCYPGSKADEYCKAAGLEVEYL